VFNSILVALDCSKDCTPVVKTLDALRLSPQASLRLCHRKKWVETSSFIDSGGRLYMSGFSNSKFEKL
jgi:hypothetical protein